MASRTITVGSKNGLHARPAAMLVAAAAAAPVMVTIRTADKPPVPAASMLCVLALGARYGTEVTLQAEGDGADAALDALADLVSRTLDEDADA
jgi:phosphocarrier protein HPr